MSGGALRAVQAAWNKLIDLPAIDFTEHEAREIVAGIGHELRATAHGDEPVAWMLRAARALHTRSARQYGEYRVICGKVFMSEETAAAAAERETNSWRKVEAFPVYASVDPGRVRDDQIEAAAKAHCDFFGGEGWWDTGLIVDTKPAAMEAMRAAVRAIGGAVQ